MLGPPDHSFEVVVRYISVTVSKYFANAKQLYFEGFGDEPSEPALQFFPGWYPYRRNSRFHIQPVGAMLYCKKLYGLGGELRCRAA
jgi:hypothetical protein